MKTWMFLAVAVVLVTIAVLAPAVFAQGPADGYGSAEGLDAIGDVSRAGANTVTFIVTVYQTDASANAFRIDPERTPTKEAIGDAIVRAKSLSFPMAVSIKPHVDLDDGSWRGDIRPRDPGKWFSSYRAFILDWARWADGLRVDQLVVGTELAGTLEAAFDESGPSLVVIPIDYRENAVLTRKLGELSWCN